MGQRIVTVVVLLAVVGCGGIARSSSRPLTPPRATYPTRPARGRGAESRAAAVKLHHRVGSSPRGRSPSRPASVRAPASVALVTAPSENRLLVVALPSGRVVQRIAVAGEPEYSSVLGVGGPVVVVSAHAGTVSLLGGTPLKRTRLLGGFVSPHIPAMTPDGEYAYVTDDQTGLLTAIGLSDQRIETRTYVGRGAHHLAVSPNLHQVWVALGQSARTITILSTQTSPPPGVTGGFWANPGHPHVTGHFAPGFPVHAVLFAPDGRRVWLTNASGPQLGVFDARSHELRFRVPAGPAPQHVVFAGPDAYVTSGYGSSIEQVRWSDGRVLHKVPAPYGSFELDASGRYVVTASLFQGTLAIYDRNLHLIAVRHLAPSTEDVTIDRP